MEFGPDLLATDFVPDKTTASSPCATTVGRQKEEMNRTDETIHSPESPSRIRELRAHKEPVQRVNKALVTSELPPEMLGRVFDHCLPATDVPLYHAVQLLLMQICRRWRRIAASTPSLWTMLVLHGGSESNPCQIIRMGLANSGVLPMTVRIAPDPWCKRWNKPEAMRLLLENFHRFKDFDSGEDDDLYQALLSYESIIFAPLLETFRISYDCDAAVPRPLPLPCIQTHHLRSVSLTHISLINLILFDPFDLFHVSLDIGQTQDLAPVLRFLASCPNIYHLDIMLNDGVQPPEIGGRSRTLLPAVEILRVDCYCEDDLLTFLQTIEIPAIQQLLLMPRPDLMRDTLAGYPGSWDMFGSLFNDKPPLRELCVDMVRFTDGLFASTLGRLQCLRSLTLSNCTIDDSILQSLTPDIGSPASEWPCPSLSKITVTNSLYSCDLFLKLVQSRVPMTPDGAVNGIQYLQHVDVSEFEVIMDTEDENAFIAALQDIQKSCDGYNLQIST